MNGAAISSAVQRKEEYCGCHCQQPLGYRSSRQGLSRPPEDTAKKAILGTYKLCAKKRGLVWGLTLEEFNRLIAGDCHYCDSKPSNVRFIKAVYKKNDIVFEYSGVDRMDNSKGYLSDNVVSCCKICNYAKRTLSMDQWNEWIDRLVAHRLLASTPATAPTIPKS